MFSLTELLPVIGYAGITVIVFAESGLLIGFFLPGDSLLFTAGFLASQGIFNIFVLAALSFVAAVAGDSVGYWFGHRIGRKIFQRENSILFHKDNLLRAEKFYEKHGGKAIILARFMPVIRTFAPILAGVGAMQYKKFLTFNIVGGALWAVGVPLAGYFLGTLIPNVDKYLVPIVLGIIIVSVMPSLIHVLRTKEDRARLMAALRTLLRRK
ncbi:MAG: VTT domain-containing protein [Candidatus Andersenbacteria bacterium]|nr:VTT domain-containing protein [Candidatus Andersenbacteria bacterium]